MANQELKLDYIESGRMSDNEMDRIYGGVWSCETYANCHKTGKSSCSEFKSCSDVNDPNNRTYCKNKYLWVAEVLEEETMMLRCISE